MYRLGATVPSIVNRLTSLGAKFISYEEAGLPQNLMQSTHNNFGPRLGFAYRGGEGAKSFVLRGGYRIAYFPIPLRPWSARMRRNPPLNARFRTSLTDAALSPDGVSDYGTRTAPNMIAGVNSRDAVTLENANALTRGSFGVSYFASNQPDPRVQDWNFTIEKEVMPDTLARVAYVGNHGSHLEQYYSYNEPTPEYIWYATTRAGVPVEAMYLPMFEHWPGDLHKHYRADDPARPKTAAEYQALVNRHALTAGPMEGEFSTTYQDRFSAIVLEFARHIKPRGWNKHTKYLVYLNNKYYRKRPPRGDGISWWLLDEPNHRDDFRAINFFAWLTKRRLHEEPGSNILFRTDISRVDWMRDLLTGQVDLNVVSRRLHKKTRLLQDRERFGKELWNYATTNHPRTSNLTLRAWAWRVWLNGGNGLLPWVATRTQNAWDRTVPLTVFYSGAKFGQLEPFASLRLKAYRRGQQDMEYVNPLASTKGWSREVLRRAILEALDFPADVTESFDEDAGTLRFQHLRDEDLETLRLRLVDALADARIDNAAGR